MQNGRKTLQSHTGINGRTFQRNTRAVRQVFKLVKHQIPNFNPAVSVFFRRTGQTTPNFGSVVKKDFGAGAAGTGIAHLPEIVFCRNTDNTVVRQSGNFFPDIISLVVRMINRNGQAGFIHVKFFGQQFPSP